MPGKNKLMRFADNLTFDNLFQLLYEQLVKGFELKGNWNKSFFKNKGDIVLELGCGKGEYTVGLAERFPHKNFIGVDVKGSRINLGLNEAKEKNLTNVAFIRARINLIEHCFGENEVSEIWITFPDPQPRNIKTKKRLTSPWFLNRFSKFLKPNGIIHLKTDNILFFEYTQDVIRDYSHELLKLEYDVYASDMENEVSQIQTYYEKIWLKNGTKIKYLQFRLNQDEG